ncbi:MAG: hypothetical protein GEU79_19200, partial [Acidimicrobiia bacterium]|nr:hypothetical protein [Acidimicrobiia bacterium]
MTDLSRHDQPESGASEPDGARRRMKSTRTVGDRARMWLRRILLAIPLLALVVWTLAPFLVTATVSFKERAAVFADPGLIPLAPSLDAYREVLSSASFTSSFVNSLVVGVGTTVLTIIIGVPAAYAFARFRFRGRHLLLLFTLLPRLVPSLGLMVPIYR